MMSPRIEELRIKAGKTRREVALDMDISERHLVRLERGHTPLRKHHRMAFARYYGVEPDQVQEDAA